MITLNQIQAEKITPALTEEQQLALETLVKAYPGYSNAVGRWPSLSDKIDAEQLLPTVKTQGLKAVITALNKLPPIVVESSGSDKAPSYFTTQANWNALAQDVLNMLFELPVTLGQQSFVLVQRRVQDLTLVDDSILARERTGRRF
jgi:hypothetical protein